MALQSKTKDTFLGDLKSILSPMTCIKTMGSRLIEKQQQHNPYPFLPTVSDPWVGELMEVSESVDDVIDELDLTEDSSGPQFISWLGEFKMGKIIYIDFHSSLGWE